MAEVTKGDLMFFQNEVLGDIKKLEAKLNIKFNTSIEELKLLLSQNDSKNNILHEKFEELTNLMNFQNKKDDNEIIQKLKKNLSKTEELTGKLDVKIEKLENELDNTNFKFDKILNWNLTLPGIIGTETCKFKSLREFLDYINKTIQTLNNNKEKNNIDLKSYKEKLENIIKSFNLQIDSVTNTFKDFCNKSIKQVEKQFFNRIEETEEKIENLRIENSKFTLDLINECEQFKINKKDLDKYKDDLETRYNDNFKKYEELHYNTVNKFEEIDKEFKLIKQKFSGLSEFIKNVRFRKNIGDTVKIQEYRDMSKKIDFTRKQKFNDEFDIEVPDFLTEIGDNHKNFVKKEPQNFNNDNKLKNQKIKLNKIQSQVKKYIESDNRDIYKEKKENEQITNIKSVSFHPNVRKVKNNNENIQIKSRNKSHINSNKFKSNLNYSNNPSDDNFDIKSEGDFNKNNQNKNYQFIEGYSRENDYNYNDSKSEVNSVKNNYYLINDENSNYLDSSIGFNLKEKNNYIKKNKKYERRNNRGKTQKYSYRIDLESNNKTYKKKIKSNFVKAKTLINYTNNSIKKSINETKDLTFTELNNIFNKDNNNEKHIQNNNNNILFHNYSKFIDKNPKKNRLNNLFNLKTNKKVYNIGNNNNFNIINTNYNTIDFSNENTEKTEKTINQDKKSNNMNKKENNENNENKNINKQNIQMKKDILEIKQNLITEKLIENKHLKNRSIEISPRKKRNVNVNPQIEEIKQFLNTNEYKSNLNKDLEESINKSNDLNQIPIYQASLSPEKKKRNFNSIDLNSENEKFDYKEFNELANNLSLNDKFNRLYISDNKNNLIKNPYKNTLDINNNNNELMKKIENIYLKFNILEETTNRKLKEIYDQLKLISSKLPYNQENEEINKKFYNSTNNFYIHGNKLSKNFLNSNICDKKIIALKKY